MVWYFLYIIFYLSDIICILYVAMENLSFIELGFNPRTGQTGQTGKEAEKNYWLLIQVDCINHPRFITVAYKVKENQNFIELKLSIMTITNRWINVELIQ